MNGKEASAGLLLSQISPTTGYYHSGYAHALSEFGTPLELAQSKAYYLKRTIPGESDADGLGCYPFLFCKNWSALASDLDLLSHELVSFAALPDPFGAYTMSDLQRAFPDFVTPFKLHYVADLSQPYNDIVSKTNRYYARKALVGIEVEIHPEPLRFLEQWTVLFSQMVERFQLQGIRAFSRRSFELQLGLPGAYIALARYRGEPIAAHIHLLCGEVLYAHVAAVSPDANALGASYALLSTAIRYFADKARWLNWGGAAGINSGGQLSDFKRGWSTETRPAYFCGRIFNPERYHALALAKGCSASTYFPAYRAGEFV